MNKFSRTLSGNTKTIREERAELIAEDVQSAQNFLVEEVKKKKRDLVRKLASLTDLYPDSKLTLKVVKDDFDANEWVKEIQAIKVQLAMVEVELTIAENTNKEWFTEEEESK